MEDALDVWNAMRSSMASFKEWMPFAQQSLNCIRLKRIYGRRLRILLHGKICVSTMFMKETGEFVGSTGLHRIDWTVPKFEIGYWLDTEFEGNGYMTEAVERLDTVCF